MNTFSFAFIDFSCVYLVLSDKRLGHFTNTNYLFVSLKDLLLDWFDVVSHGARNLLINVLGGLLVSMLINVRKQLRE